MQPFVPKRVEVGTTTEPVEIFFGSTGALQSISVTTLIEQGEVTQFEVWARGSPDAEFVKLAFEDKDFTDPKVLAIVATNGSGDTNLNALKSGDVGMFGLDLFFFEAVIVKVAGTDLITKTTARGHL